MSNKIAILHVLIGLMMLAAITGCSSGAPPTPAAATQAPGGAPLESKQVGDLKLTLYSSPNPPIRGANVIQVSLTDAAGKPVNGAKVSFDLDMTNMSHGKNVVPAEPAGQGLYSGQVSFMMPGPWRSIVVIERPGQPPIQARFDFRVNMR
jgi:hypothetical protein